MDTRTEREGCSLRRAASIVLTSVVVSWCVACSGVASKDGSPRSQPDAATSRVEIVEDQDDPLTWDDVRSFAKSPSPTNTAKVFKNLDEMLANWSSHPPGIATTILDAIGEHRVEDGRKYLIRFLHVEPALPSAAFVASSAALALGRLGGPSAFDELTRATAWSTDDLAASVAVALGVLKDPLVVSSLEALVLRRDGQVRRRALSALAAYCSSTSRPLAIGNLADPDERVRSSAAFWLASCGIVTDADYLSTCFRDPNPMVRKHGLVGLERIRSRAGCEKLRDLLTDGDIDVRRAAENYQRFCVEGK